MDTEGVFKAREKESSFEIHKESSTTHYKVTHTSITEQRTGPMNIIFWAAVGASQIVAVVCITLVVYWCKQYGGFSWSDGKQQFFLHPLCMVLGLILCYGDAILVYRVLSFVPKWILKLVHAVLHLLAIVLSSVGLAAVFENHRKTDKPDLYSLHSWIGLATFSLFCTQYVFSFVTFLFPGLPPAVRAAVMPIHTFFGIGIFMMAVASALMGINERLFFLDDYANWVLPPKGVVGNSLGVFIVIFALLVAFLATESRYKRQPLPSEIAPTN